MTSGRRRQSMNDFLDAQRSSIEDAAGYPGAPPQPRSEAAMVSAASLPEPYAPAGGGQLTEREMADLAACEGAVDNLRTAFWAAGKALQVIRDGLLYRETHGNFDDYLQARWDMSRAQAYRLIDAWPLAERLSPMGDKLNERQVRELLPLAGRHGPDAAVAVFRTVAQADGVQVTAAVLHRAVSVLLPADHFDAAEAADQVRAYLASAPGRARPTEPDPVATFTAETAKLLKVLHRVANPGTLKAVAREKPDALRQVLAEMRAVLDKIERGAI